LAGEIMGRFGMWVERKEANGQIKLSGEIGGTGRRRTLSIIIHRWFRVSRGGEQREMSEEVRSVGERGDKCEGKSE